MRKERGNLLEISRIKTEKEEEKFDFQFSGVQLNSIMLFMLGATFLISGSNKIGEIVGDLDVIKIWLFFTILSILILTLSVFMTMIGNALAVQKIRRFYNIMSLLLFLLGAVVFFVSLIVLLSSF